MSKNNLIQIGGELFNSVGDGIIADAAAVKDYTEGKTQATINAEMRASVPQVVSINNLDTIATTGVFYVKNEEDDVQALLFCYEEKAQDNSSYYVQYLINNGKFLVRSGQLPLSSEWVDYLQLELNNKVNRRTGYDLSQNDFTDYYKGSIGALQRDVTRLTEGKLGWEFVEALPDNITYDTVYKVYFIQSTSDANCVDAWIVDTSVSPNAWKQIGKSIDTSTFYVKPSGGIPKTDLASAVQTSLDKADASQAAIGDLSTIRSGAAAGATAYQKPQAGIPKTDLASDVQTSLGKADTAVQPAAMNTALGAKQDTINTVNVTVDNNTGTPSGSASVSGGTLTLNFSNLKGATGEQGPQGIQGVQGVQGPKGDTGVTGDASSLAIIHGIDKTSSYGTTDVCGADAAQALFNEIEGGFYY